MFERFTERARQVVVLAQEEAKALRHGHIGTEHILLGLVCEEEGLAHRVLESMGLNTENVHGAVAAISPKGKAVPAEDTQIPFTTRAKKTIELALREALTLGNNYIGTEHVLLGLIREKDCKAMKVLKSLKVEPDALKEAIVNAIKSPEEGERDKGSSGESSG